MLTICIYAHGLCGSIASTPPPPSNHCLHLHLHTQNVVPVLNLAKSLKRMDNTTCEVRSGCVSATRDRLTHGRERAVASSKCPHYVTPQRITHTNAENIHVHTCVVCNYIVFVFPKALGGNSVTPEPIPTPEKSIYDILLFFIPNTYFTFIGYRVMIF